MNKRTQLVLDMLKTKVSSLGFSKEEIKSIADKLSGNLISADDAEDEVVNAEISQQIDAVMPFLKLGQSVSSRVIQSNNASHAKAEEELKSQILAAQKELEDFKKSAEKTPKKEEEVKVTPKAEANSEYEALKEAQREMQKEMQKALKAMAEASKTNSERLTETITSLQNELAGMKSQRLGDERLAKMENLVKNTGAFGTSVLRTFKKLKFESDEDFDSHYEEVKRDLEAMNQERANVGLEKLGVVPQVDVPQPKNEPEPFSDEEIKELAGM